jgi:hypothetical protein
VEDSSSLWKEKEKARKNLGHRFDTDQRGRNELTIKQERTWAERAKRAAPNSTF